MHEQPTRQGRPAETRPETGVYVNGEVLPEGPHIYVVNEAEIARGLDRGSWIKATLQPPTLAREIRKLLPAQSSRGPLLGWAIHGYTGFGDWQLGRYEELDKISRVAREIANNGQAFGSWVQLVKGEPELESGFKEHYLGSWGSLEDFVDEFAADLGMTLHNLDLSVRWRPYVRLDRQALLDEILRPGEIVVSQHDTQISVFLNPHVEGPALLGDAPQQPASDRSEEAIPALNPNDSQSGLVVNSTDSNPRHNV